MVGRVGLLSVLALAAAVGLVGCSPGGPPKFEGPPVRCVCTTTIVADAVARVGGDRVTVEALMGPGVDPHKYTPTAGDRARLERAHLVFFNGLHLEGKMADVFEQPGGRLRAVAVTRGITPHTPSGAAEPDPHVWFDVAMWKAAVECVRDELAALDAGGAEAYRANAAAYLAELDELDAYVRREVARVPKERRVLVTSHDAFGYFGRAYGFEVHGLQGVSTASEAGTADVQALANVIKAGRVPAVFAETSVDPQGLKAVLDSVTTHPVAVVEGEAGSLYSDALGPPGSPGATYPGMVRHNVDTIVRHLAR